MKKLIVPVLFYGALWGILEATVGYVLHFIPTAIAGSIMFPIAAIILYRAYKATDSAMSLLAVGAIASAIKSIDFLLPQLSVFKTLNPMMAILFESVVVVLVVRLLLDKRPAVKYAAFPIASIAWRTLFIGWLGIQYQLTGNLAPLIRSMSAGVNFVVVSGLLSGAIASVLLLVFERVEIKEFKLSKNPVFASIAVLIALALTYLL